MKRASLLVLLLLTTVFHTIAIAVTIDPAKARQQIQAIYQQIDQALVKNDLKVGRAFESDDLKAKTREGEVMSRLEYDIAVAQALLLAKEITSSVTNIDDIKNSDQAGEVTITATQTVKMIIAGPDGKDHELIATTRALNIWHYDETNGWRIKYIEELDGTITIDGVKVEQKARIEE